MSINRSVSTAIGEYLVLGELLKFDLEAYLAHGNTQKGWDIAVVRQHRTIRLQVKTIDWPKQQAVNGIFSGFDFLVVVLLNRQEKRSRFLIFNQKEIESLISKENKARIDKKRTMTISRIFLKKNNVIEDAWEKLNE